MTLEKIKTIVLSRMDNLGDAVLLFPLFGYIKTHYPHIKTVFLGRNYNQGITQYCQYIDAFLNWETLKKDLTPLKNLQADAFLSCCAHTHPLFWQSMKATIPLRVGRTSKNIQWKNSTHLVCVRNKSSQLHEIQRTFKFLYPLITGRRFTMIDSKIKRFFPLSSLTTFYGWKKPTIPPHIQAMISPQKFNLILHPKSNGNGKEWSPKNYAALIQSLPPEKYNIIVTGTAQEKKKITTEYPTLLQMPQVQYTLGTLSLQDFVALINAADGLVASGTGPIHIAAASGIYALGLYPTFKPIHATRWKPIGQRASYLEDPVTHRKNAYLHGISVATVKEHLEQWKK